jgi:hypothetical protein
VFRVDSVEGQRIDRLTVQFVPERRERREREDAQPDEG